MSDEDLIPTGGLPDEFVSEHEAGFLDPMVGRKVGGFKIKSLIATGGMGSVYVAVQEQPRRKVALKLMKAGIASRSALRRFEFESQILARLHHPHIAQVYEAGTHDDGSGGVPYFAMEYVPNARSITDYANTNKLGTGERLVLFAKTCDAVHHGHQKGIIHRDLKPSNILVDSAGEPKIIDFGVARATDSDLAITTLQTNIGQLIGTLQYMAPEQCTADPDDLDTRCDVYALGVVLFHLLCGRPPYDVSTVTIVEAARMIQEETPARLSTINRTLRGDLETITLKTLEKDRNRRYRSAEALGDDVRRHLAGEPIEAHPPSVVYQLGRFAKRHRALVGAVAAVMLVLVAGIVATSLALVRAIDSEELARTSSEKAERNFEMARNAVDEYLTNVSEDVLLAESGMQPLRKRLLESALVFYETLAREGANDAGLQEDVPKSLERVAAITEQISTAEDAVQRWRLAGDAWRRLFENNPNEPRFACGEARTLRRALSIGDSLGGSDAYRGLPESMESLEALAEKFPDNEMVLIELAQTYVAMGESMSSVVANNAPEEEIAYYLKAIDIQKRLLEHRATDDENRINLVEACIEAGFYYSRNTEFDTSIVYLDKAREICRAVLADPQSQQHLAARGFLPRVLLNLGFLQERQKEPGPALHLYKESFKVADKLASENPAVVAYEQNCIGALLQIVVLRQRYPQALQEEPAVWADRAVQRALDMWPRAVGHERQETVVLETLCNAGALQWSRGRHAESLRGFEKLVQWADSSLARDPNQEYTVFNRRIAYKYLGDLQAVHENWPAAIDSYREFVHTHTVLHASAPSEYKRWHLQFIAIGHANLAWCHHQAGHRADSIAAARQAHPGMLDMVPMHIGHWPAQHHAQWSARLWGAHAQTQLAQLLEDPSFAAEVAPDADPETHYQRAVGFVRFSAEVGRSDANSIRADNMLQPLSSRSDFQTVLSELAGDHDTGG